MPETITKRTGNGRVDSAGDDHVRPSPGNGVIRVGDGYITRGASGGNRRIESADIKGLSYGRDHGVIIHHGQEDRADSF